MDGAELADCESQRAVRALCDRVLPFHFRVNSSGRITHMGPALAKLLPDALGQLLADLLEGSTTAAKGAEDLLVEESMQRLAFTKPNFLLRGQLIPDGSGELIFVGLLDPRHVRGLADMGLSMGDFPANDLTVEFAMLQWARNSQIEETRTALERLRASKALGESLKVQATTDFLTGIGNRARFMELLDEAMENDEPIELMMIDMDRFKSINDLHGHAVGDEMLRLVAGELAMVVGDHGLVARLGGDEFGVLLVGSDAVAAGDQVSSAIASLNTRTLPIGGVMMPLRLTVGRAVRRQETEAGELMRHADIAMYAARRTADTTIGIFDPTAQAELRLRRSIASDLPGAIARGELQLHYQPIVDMTTFKPVGFEALCRWNHPKHGPIPPMVFVEVAEHSNIIDDLDRFVITTALEEVRLRRESVGSVPAVSVNLSALSLTDCLAEFLTDALDAAGHRPEDFIVEVTETASISDLDRTMRVLHRLNDRGIVVALDDFGTGYSSLAHLHQLPIGELKVDRSFVNDMLTSRKALEVVRSILHVSSLFKLPVVAEGIETIEQATLLANLGCERGQGYYFARPAPMAEMAPRDVALPPSPCPHRHAAGPAGSTGPG